MTSSNNEHRGEISDAKQYASKVTIDYWHTFSWAKLQYFWAEVKSWTIWRLMGNKFTNWDFIKLVAQLYPKMLVLSAHLLLLLSFSLSLCQSICNHQYTNTYHHKGSRISLLLLWSLPVPGVTPSGSRLSQWEVLGPNPWTCAVHLAVLDSPCPVGELLSYNLAWTLALVRSCKDRCPPNVMTSTLS